MKKTKAFTLTELLVVVVIIGVLSAIVLPKFSKVLETRKTTEAEAMLMAVRGEQEARCALDKPYVQEAHKGQLASLPSNTGNNYTYTLTGSGVTASSQDKDYTLSIKSYEDGRICCSGTYCASLNKKYPSCDELPADNSGCGVADVGPSPNPCAGGDCEPEPPCNLTDYTHTCQEEGYGAEYTGNVTYTVNADCTGYTKADSCTKQETACTPGENRLKEPYEECWEGCGEIWESCDDQQKWSSHCQSKETTQCMPGAGEKVEEEDRNGVIVKVTYSCQSCKWVKTGEEEGCPDNKVRVDGVCCLPGQIVKNGQCLYKYRPNRFEVNILVVCHDASYELTMPASAIVSEQEFNDDRESFYEYDSYDAYVQATIRQYQGTQGSIGAAMKSPRSCSVMGYVYYRGGNIPWFNGGQGCDWHYAVGSAGRWWEGGTRIEGNKVSGTDQEWCDANCGASANDCSIKGFIDYGNPPDHCDSYHCNNGWHCDNAPGGTATALECIREY